VLNRQVKKVVPLALIGGIAAVAVAMLSRKATSSPAQGRAESASKASEGWPAIDNRSRTSDKTSDVATCVPSNSAQSPHNHTRSTHRLPLPPFWLLLLALSLLAFVFGYRELPIAGPLPPPPLFQSEVIIRSDQPNTYLVAMLDATNMTTSSGEIPLYLLTNPPQGELTLLTTGDVVGSNSSNASNVIWRVNQNPNGNPWYGIAQDPATDLRQLPGNIEESTQHVPVASITLNTDQVTFSGSRLQITMPNIYFGGYIAHDPTSPSGTWYPPTGEIIVLAPQETLRYRTDVVTPAFATTGVWRNPGSLSPYWLGTDTSAEANDQIALFYSGLLLGGGAAALIAFIQEARQRYLNRQQKKESKRKLFKRTSHKRTDRFVQSLKFWPFQKIRKRRRRSSLEQSPSHQPVSNDPLLFCSSNTRLN
jgi:hypothetical protein